MYTINYVSDMVDRSKFQGIFVKILRILNIVSHITIILLVLFSVFFNVKIKEYNKKIVLVKNSIIEKRETNNISAIEKQWDKYYFQLLAVKEQLSNNTNYGLILKELGNYLPEDDFVSGVKISSDVMNIELNVKRENIKKMKSPYDYRANMQSAFEKSLYFDKDKINIDSVVDDKKNVTPYVLLKIKMPIYSRK